MTVKRYNPAVDQYGDGTVTLSPDGEFISYDDYALLQQKLITAKLLLVIAGDSSAVVKDEFAEVVAERDALQQQVNALTVECAAAKIAMDYLKVGRTNFILNTPATDAAIRELQAQGVDKFRAWSDCHIEQGDEYEESLLEVSRACKKFAATIRNGEQGGE